MLQKYIIMFWIVKSFEYIYQTKHYFFMNKSEINKIRENIKKLAKEFNLNYKKELYKVTFLTKKEFAILQFLIGCPDPIYTKFGGTTGKRIKNINEFLNSKDFIKLSNKCGGNVVNIKTFQKNIEKIKDNRIKKKSERILKKLKSESSSGVVTLTTPRTEREKKFILKTILFHEWIHVLLMSNKIYFQDIKPGYWKLDEGLTTYLQISFEKKSSDISKIIKKKMKKSLRDSLYIIYAKNALKFNKILKNKRDPNERKKAILDYLRQKFLLL